MYSTRGCHCHTFCINICDRGQNRSQESNIKKPASQRISSVGEGSLGQQPTRYANTTIDTNVVDEECIGKGQTSFSAKVKGQGPFFILTEFDRGRRC